MVLNARQTFSLSLLEVQVNVSCTACLPRKIEFTEVNWVVLNTTLSPIILFFNGEHSSSSGLLVNITAIKETILIYRERENDYQWDWNSGIKFQHHRENVLISSE